MLEESKINLEKTNWQKMLESIVKKDFFINTSNVLIQKADWVKYAENQTNYQKLDFSVLKELKNFIYPLINIEREGFKKSPEIVFFVDTKLIYEINPLKFFDTKIENIPNYVSSLNLDQEILFDIACWRDIHSGRSGNYIKLIIDLGDEDFLKNLKNIINKNPLKVREILEGIVLKRMSDLKHKWIDYDYQNLENNLISGPGEVLLIEGSLKPPYIALEKLGYNKIGVMSDNSTKDSPCFEDYEINNKE